MQWTANLASPTVGSGGNVVDIAGAIAASSRGEEVQRDLMAAIQGMSLHRDPYCRPTQAARTLRTSPGFAAAQSYTHSLNVTDRQQFLRTGNVTLA